MKDRHFLDTNIFIYSFDATAPTKRRVARDLIASALRSGLGIVSFQVIQEFSSTALRKFAKPMTTTDLRDYVGNVLAPLCEIHSSMDLYDLCLNIHEKSKYAYYDSLIVAAAAAGGCRVLFSEDLQHDRTVAGVRIVNPFL
jgi:predicted nucleic acid-binding protein